MWRRQSKSVRFTALLHHITVDLLKQSYLARQNGKWVIIHKSYWL